MDLVYVVHRVPPRHAKAVVETKGHTNTSENFTAINQISFDIPIEIFLEVSENSKLNLKCQILDQL